MTSTNYFKETITLHCDVRLDVERRCLHAHDTHAPLKTEIFHQSQFSSKFCIKIPITSSVISFLYICTCNVGRKKQHLC